MARCDVELGESYYEALQNMNEAARGQVAVVIRSLEENCTFQGDEAEFIIQVSRYITAMRARARLGLEHPVVSRGRKDRSERRTIGPRATAAEGQLILESSGMGAIQCSKQSSRQRRGGMDATRRIHSRRKRLFDPAAGSDSSCRLRPR